MKEYFCCLTYRFLETIQRCKICYKTPQKIKMHILEIIDK